MRPGTPSPAQASSPSSRAPWWARVFVKGGQPLAVVVVMVMCAPGEHHLARLAGWDDRLAWGMAALLAGYAGMAAYLAGERKKGEPGHRTAVAGSVLALLLAMAAQPVSHLFVTGWFSAEPRTPVLLVIVVSCVPAPVLGHILHLAATGARTEPAEPLRTITETSDSPTPEQAEQADPSRDGTEQAEPTRFLTTREVADRYGVKTSTVGTWKDRGKVTPALVDPAMGNLYDPETLPPLATTD
ncbi:hypothetical protein E3E14_25215 [Streptomyces sp. ICN441]|uniref:hypothetical protein n=1 Tax=Streptomyces sp. ICN441 TaxID=2558286 RepID=UPI00106AE1AB|nr:hypothetical protein [Streptomyces sp. ICN441]TFE42487.1 hypothetical protein E3E14_25215 [Streptomyces sp. ICN441]